MSLTISDRTVLIPIDSIELIEIRQATEYDIPRRDAHWYSSEIRRRYSVVTIQTKHQQYEGVVNMSREMLEKLLYEKIATRSVMKLQATSRRW